MTEKIKVAIDIAIIVIAIFSLLYFPSCLISYFYRRYFIKKFGSYFQMAGCEVKASNFLDFSTLIKSQYKGREILVWAGRLPYDTNLPRFFLKRAALFSIKLKDRSAWSLRFKLLSPERLSPDISNFKIYELVGNYLRVTVWDKEIPDSSEKMRALLEELYNKAQSIESGQYV